jgi:heat shock protein HtpX
MRRFRRDPGLSFRIALSLVGLLVLYVPLFAWIAGIGWFVAGGIGAVLAAALVLFLLLLPLWNRDGVPGAVPLQAADAPELHGAVQRLCALADVPAPALELLHVPYPNAFTIARTPATARWS